MCAFQDPFLIPMLLGMAMAPFAMWFLYRILARKLLKRFWLVWYLRRSVDVSFISIELNLPNVRKVVCRKHSHLYSHSHLFYARVWLFIRKPSPEEAL